MKSRIIVLSRETKIFKLLWSMIRSDHTRPKTREECANIPKPCPYISCRHNMSIDIQDNGNIKVTAIGLDHSNYGPEFACCLDSIDKHKKLTFEEIGKVLGVSKQRVQQIALSGLKKMKENGVTLKEWH